MTTADRAAALRMLRAYRGVTQHQLAETAGIAKATVSSYERGRQEVGPANLDAMLSALGVTLTDFGETARLAERLNPDRPSDPSLTPEASRMYDLLEDTQEAARLAGEPVIERCLEYLTVLFAAGLEDFVDERLGQFTDEVQTLLRQLDREGGTDA